MSENVAYTTFRKSWPRFIAVSQSAPGLGEVFVKEDFVVKQLFCLSAIAALAACGSAEATENASDTATPNEIRALYARLIDAENRHDLRAVRALIWNSPSMLFVAKTATVAEGNWAGFWGTETVMAHLGDLYAAGPFRIDPDYSAEKVVGLTSDVAETYAPVKITVAYAGQSGAPKPFLMILEWIRTPQGWRMATDIALPIPPAQAGDH
jgi:hypothetical protein